jgi:Lecithin retinol acyltransferase
VVDVQRRKKRFYSRDLLLRAGEEPPLASHLVTARKLYSHHGIYTGNGRVIHYGGTNHGLRRRSVEDISLEHFAHGRSIRVRHDRPRFYPREVLARARSRLGERSYRIWTNNCEHLCEWCLHGASRSNQVERFLAGARSFACALLGTLGLVAGAPSFADSTSEHAEAGTFADPSTSHEGGAPTWHAETPITRPRAARIQRDIAAGFMWHQVNGCRQTRQA